MDPLSALGACSSILQIIDFSCKLLSKGRELHTSFSGVLPENVQLEKVIAHLHDLVTRLRQQSGAQTQGLDGLIAMCIQTADELIGVLEKLKIQGANTRWKSFRAAIKSVWKKEKIEEMLSRLQLIRDEIEFGVIIDLREELVGLAAQQTIRFDSMDQSTAAILQAILDGQSASTAASNVQQQAINDMNVKLEALIINEHQQTRNEIIDEIRQQNYQNATRGGFLTMSQLIPVQGDDEQMDVLALLKFVAIDDRHSAIPEAHKRTFEWIWKSHTSDQKWGNFWDWLTRGGGIYWIAGKAGSGKSTLMKYIYHDPRTQTGLQHWSNQTEVVTAGFFFWNSGSKMQKSLLGLLRSILYEVLQQKPDLKDTVFPEDVQKDIRARWRVHGQQSDTIWTIANLTAAFERLLQTPSLKICLFIDGLDEFEGNHDEIADLFKRIITSPNVKACLSSRPLVVFERSFSRCPSLRLQDLTYNDITLFVREKLEDREEVLYMRVASPSEYQRLVDEIITRASGVFLWVTLVVRSLLEGLTNHDRMSDLRTRLKEIPDDLSQLYWHMLRSIKPAFYFAQGAKLLKIMHAAHVLGIFDITTECLAFAEEYTLGERIPRMSSDLYQSWAKGQETMMIGRLKSRCRGLLEVRSHQVGFLHQSVPDFLAQPEVKDSLDEKVPKPFSPYAALLAGMLNIVKNDPSRSTVQFSLADQDQLEVLIYLARLADDESGRANILLVEEIDDIFSEKTKKSGFWSWHPPDLQRLSWAGIIAHKDEHRPYAWNDTFLSWCLQRGLINYVCEQLDSGASMYQGPQGKPLLHFLICFKTFKYWIITWGDFRRLFDLCRVLLERGANPNEVFRGKTAWEKFLEIALMNSFDPEWDPSTGYPEYKWKHLVESWICLELMNLFLDYGADPSAGPSGPTWTSTDEEPVNPLAARIRETTISSDRNGTNQLYNRLISLGGASERYWRPRRPQHVPLIWQLLPEPHPEDIPGPATRDLNDFTPKFQKPTREYPDSEGMIPVDSELCSQPPLRRGEHPDPVMQVENTFHTAGAYPTLTFSSPSAATYTPEPTQSLSSSYDPPWPWSPTYTGQDKPTPRLSPHPPVSSQPTPGVYYPQQPPVVQATSQHPYPGSTHTVLPDPRYQPPPTTSMQPYPAYQPIQHQPRNYQVQSSLQSSDPAASPYHQSHDGQPMVNSISYPPTLIPAHSAPGHQPYVPPPPVTPIQGPAYFPSYAPTIPESTSGLSSQPGGNTSLAPRPGHSPVPRKPVPTQAVYSNQPPQHSHTYGYTSPSQSYPYAQVPAGGYTTVSVPQHTNTGGATTPSHLMYNPPANTPPSYHPVYPYRPQS